MASKPRLLDLTSFYHVYNCGVEKRVVFLSDYDCMRFIDACIYYLYDQSICYSQYLNLSLETKKDYIIRNRRGKENLRVIILCYCLMPNHFHFLIKQARYGGMSMFLSDVVNSYTRYFNKKNERFGALFQGPYKSKNVSEVGSLLQVSRYIHLNPAGLKTEFSSEDIVRYPYSSFACWIGGREDELVDGKELSRWVDPGSKKQSYKEFVESKLGKNISGGIESLILE